MAENQTSMRAVVLDVGDPAFPETDLGHHVPRHWLTIDETERSTGIPDPSWMISFSLS